MKLSILYKRIDRRVLSCLVVFAIVVLFMSLVSIYIGFRGSNVGADTQNYIDIYNLVDLGIETKHEVGFILLIKLIQVLGGSVEVFFSLVAFLVSLFMYLCFFKFVDAKNAAQLAVFSVIFFSCIFFSSWYYTGVVNGLRQAISLSIFYYSLTFLSERRFFLFLFFFAASAFFHQSAIALLPFILMILLPFFNLRVGVASVLLFALGYYLGVNELVFKFFSDLLGLGFHHMVSTYALDDGGAGQWVGFDIRFVLYNLFWFFLPLILMRFGLVDESENLVFLIKIFALLCIFYFVFGFGAFSNRWAFSSWLMIPILQAYLLSHMKVGLQFKASLCIFFPLSIMFFVDRISGF